MKILIILAIANSLYFSASAQDSCYVKKVDQFTGVERWQMKEVFKFSNNVSMWAAAGGAGSYKNCFNIGFVSKDVLGVDQKSTITLLFDDGQKLELGQFGLFNLKGEFYSCITDMGIGGGKKKLKSLFNKKLTAVRLTGITSFVDAQVPADVAERLMTSLNCLYNGWQTGK